MIVNRRAQIEKVFTGVPVMLIVFFLLVIFIFVSSSLSHTKDLTKYQYFSKSTVVQDSILFNNITINGENSFIARELIKEYNSSCSVYPSTYLSDEFISKLNQLMINDVKFLNKKSCLMLDIGDLSDSELGNNFYRKKGNCYFYSIKNESNVIIKPYNPAGEKLAEAALLNEFNVNWANINLNDKQINVAAYYGAC